MSKKLEEGREHLYHPKHVGGILLPGPVMASTTPWGHAIRATMAEYLCNGYICECGTTLKVFSQDRSTPMRPDPGRGYLVVVTCPQCGKSRSLNWKQIQDLPLIWTEQR